MDILINTEGRVVARAKTITDTGAGWDVDGAIYPAGLERVQAVSPPANAVGLHTFAAGVFTRLPDTPEEIGRVRAEKLAALAAVRQKRETAGITLPSGAAIDTSEAGQARVSAALAYVGRRPAATIRWKTRNGWRALNRVQIEALADAVGDHVQACFAREAELSAQIEAATTVAEVEAVDITVGWP